jgi:maleate isomerase
MMLIVMVVARGRIGVILPADANSDRDFWQYVPKNVIVMVTRIRLMGDEPSSSLTPEAIRHIGETKEIESCAYALKSSRAHAIAYACTSGSFQRPGMDSEIAERIRKVTERIPSTTTSLASKEALQALGVVKVAVLSPYPQFLSSLLNEYLSRNGLEIVNLRSLELAAGRNMCDVSPWELYKWEMKTDTPEADGLFIPCTSLSTAEAIDPLEHDLGKPVVTANQAPLWKALRLARIKEPVHGVGRLLEKAM